MDSEDGIFLKEDMVDEMESLHKNEAWDLVDFLDGRNPIGRKWVFKNKINVEGVVTPRDSLELYKDQCLGHLNQQGAYISTYNGCQEGALML